MNNQVTKPSANPIKDYFAAPAVQKAIEKLLGGDSNTFIASVLQAVNDNSMLKDADPKTVFMAAATAAALNLPINKNLGFAYIVPYRNKKVIEAQFQMGYRGFIQLAQRSGQMQSINACAVYEGDSEQDILDRLTMFMPPVPRSDTVIGYVAYFKLLNGFTAHVSMRDHEIKAHALEFSQAYRSAEKKGDEWKQNTSPWHKHYDTMAKKTVLKMLISKQAPMSIDSALTEALNADQAVIRDVDGQRQYDYVDNQSNDNNQQAPQAITQQLDITNNPAIFQNVMNGVISGSVDKVELLKGNGDYIISEDQRKQVAEL